jgi:recombinational DNA repair ATPase RecF
VHGSTEASWANLALTPRITGLVGKNESGKTAVIEAIYLKALPSGHPED